MNKTSGCDTWRDPKLITPPKLPVMISNFGLKIARIATADTIFIAILQKRGKAAGTIPPSDNMKMQPGCN